MIHIGVSVTSIVSSSSDLVSVILSEWSFWVIKRGWTLSLQVLWYYTKGRMGYYCMIWSAAGSQTERHGADDFRFPAGLISSAPMVDIMSEKKWRLIVDPANTSLTQKQCCTCMGALFIYRFKVLNSPDTKGAHWCLSTQGEHYSRHYGRHWKVIVSAPCNTSTWDLFGHVLSGIIKIPRQDLGSTRQNIQGTLLTIDNRTFCNCYCMVYCVILSCVVYCVVCCVIL